MTIVKNKVKYKNNQPKTSVSKQRLYNTKQNLTR